jgi:hypothetical protein
MPKKKSTRKKSGISKLKKGIAAAKKIYNKKGNTKAWKTCVKQAFDK